MDYETLILISMFIIKAKITSIKQIILPIVIKKNPNQK